MNHFGFYKNIDGTTVEYSGTTQPFTVRFFIYIKISSLGLVYYHLLKITV